MRRAGLILAVLALLLGSSGCITKMSKSHVPNLPRTAEIFLGETKVFKDATYALKGIEDFGKPADHEPYYQEVVRSYREDLARELREKGFIVRDNPTDNSLIIESKVADYPARWYRIVSLGVIGTRVGVRYRNELVWEGEEMVNTSLFHSPSLQIKRGVAPRLAERLKNEFLRP